MSFSEKANELSAGSQLPAEKMPIAFFQQINYLYIIK